MENICPILLPVHCHLILLDPAQLNLNQKHPFLQPFLVVKLWQIKTYCGLLGWSLQGKWNNLGQRTQFILWYVTYVILCFLNLSFWKKTFELSEYKSFTLSKEISMPMMPRCICYTLYKCCAWVTSKSWWPLPMPYLVLPSITLTCQYPVGWMIQGTKYWVWDFGLNPHATVRYKYRPPLLVSNQDEI